MSRFLSQNRKLILSLVLIFLISALGVFVFGAKISQANYFTDGLGGFFANCLLSIQELFGKLVAYLSGFAQAILSYTNPQSAQMVQKGWGAVRDFTNMFFVLILLAIAFATILGIESYGMKALLPKLIGAALLINFSLVLAGVFIDFSGVLTNFLIGDRTVFFTNIGKSMQLPRIVATNAEEIDPQWHCVPDYTTGEQEPGSWTTSEECQPHCNSGCYSPAQDVGTTDWSKINGSIYWTVIGSLFFSIIFTIIAVFVFGALAFFLLVRLLVIWFLLILMPIAWFFWILPATRHFFTQWWKAFIKWIFFAPVAVFFIWISVTSWTDFIRTQGGEMVWQMKEVISNEVMASSIMPQIMSPKYLIQFFLACGMLIGSLIVAQKMGVYGAQGAIKLAKGIGGKVSGVTATQRWWKARTAAREDEAKERRKRRMGLARVGGVRQWAKERFRPTVTGRAEARARKNAAITQEAKRMGNTMDWQDVMKIAGKRIAPTRVGRMQKLAAQSLLANPQSKEHQQMMSRTRTPAPGVSGYNSIRNLANRVNQVIAQQGAAGKYARYRW